MSTITTRIRKYNAKYSAANLTRDLAVKLPDMTTRYSAATTAGVAMETQVKQVLDGAGVPTIQYPFYLCFGRELWALQRREVSGESLAIEAAVLIAKWVARGLTESVLVSIRGGTFSIGAPIAP